MDDGRFQSARNAVDPMMRDRQSSAVTMCLFAWLGVTLVPLANYLAPAWLRARKTVKRLIGKEAAVRS